MKISKIKIVIAILLLSVVANIGLSYRLSCANPKFAKVDIELIISNLVKEVAAKDLSEEESQKYSQDYIKKLDNLVIKISEQEGLVILPSKAIIAGAVDITDQLEELMRGDDGK
jgi:Type-F conjugative transfer system protein (TrbI_Ftype)